MKLEHRLLVLLQLILILDITPELNQWIVQRQLQDVMRDILVLGFDATYTRGLMESWHIKSRLFLSH